MSEITITINCATPAEAREVLAALAEPLPRGTLDAMADLVTAPAAKPDTPAAKPEPAVPPTLEQAIDALKAYGRERGAVELRAVLDKLGVRRATELRPEQSGEILALVGDGAAV
jgi:hypothetical protein